VAVVAKSDLPISNRDKAELSQVLSRSCDYIERAKPGWEINHVPIDKPPWSVVNHKGKDRFKCPGCGKAVAWRAVNFRFRCGQ
jgi:hypothetical protein